MIKPRPCPSCGDAPLVDKFQVTCENCYDGAPDSGTRHLWIVDKNAVERWNEMCLDHAEPLVLEWRNDSIDGEVAFLSPFELRAFPDDDHEDAPVMWLVRPEQASGYATSMEWAKLDAERALRAKLDELSQAMAIPG